MDHYEVNRPCGVTLLMGHLTRYVNPADHPSVPNGGDQWHLWREYRSVCGKLILKPGTLWYHKDAAWKVPVAFVAVVERVVGTHLRYAVVIMPPGLRVQTTKGTSEFQWVCFVSKSVMQDAPPTEVKNQEQLCFRPAGIEVVLPSYDIMPSDEAVLKFINRTTSVSGPKYQMTRFRELHGVEPQVMKTVNGESTSTTTYYFLLATTY